MTDFTPPEAMTPAYRGRRWVHKYELLEWLGRGWEGEVYRALDPDQRRRVAIKLLLQQDVSAHTTMARFEQAVQAIAALDHPNIMRVLDFGLVDDVFFIVMELLEGPSVRDLLGERRGGLPQAEAVRITQQVIEALAYAHERGVIHGDVQPSHIIFAEDGRPILTDFSLAQVLGRETLTGTPAYVSPEQAAGQPPTLQSDLYALGVVFYEMVTGRVPFEGVDVAAVLQKHLTEPPIPPREVGANIDAHVETVIMQALAKNPAERFRSAQEMKAALEAPQDTDKYETFILKSSALKQADPEAVAQLEAARKRYRESLQTREQQEPPDEAGPDAGPRKVTGPLGGLLSRLRRKPDEDDS